MASQPPIDPSVPTSPIDDPVPTPMDPIPPTPADPVVSGGGDYPAIGTAPLSEGP